MIFPPDNDTTKVSEPSKEALNLPAFSITPQRPTILALASIGAIGSYQFYIVGFPKIECKFITIICFVSYQSFRKLLKGNVIDDFIYKSDFGKGGTVDGNSKRKAITVDHCHPLRTFSAFSFTNSGPPFLAEAKLPSIKDSLKSIFPRFSRSSNKAVLMLLIVPSWHHFWNRRWQVALGG